MKMPKKQMPEQGMPEGSRGSKSRPMPEKDMGKGPSTIHPALKGCVGAPSK